MVWLVLGLVLFLGAHLTPTFPAFRASSIARFGLNGYKLGITLASLAGLILIVYGAAVFRGSPGDIQIWSPPPWTKHPVMVLMLIAFVLLASANIPSKIRDAVKHPMLAAITVWALAHLLANGDLLALLLFGAFLLYSLYDRKSVANRGVALKERAQGFGGDIKALVGGGVIWALVLFKLHALAGAPLL
jgi:uncharacterized membrane protein